VTGLDPSRSVDEETLRYLSRAFGRRPEVHRTSLFPSNKLESLVVTLDADYYPDRVDGVSIEIRAYTNGDFHVSYLESLSGDRRRCRWDRHDQPHKPGITSIRFRMPAQLPRSIGRTHRISRASSTRPYFRGSKTGSVSCGSRRPPAEWMREG